MKRNFDRPLLGYDGKPILSGGKEQTAGSVLGLQLFSAGNGKDNIADGDKMRAYHLCVQMHEHPSEVELTAEDAKLIKDIAGHTLVAGAYGQIVDIIEND